MPSERNTMYRELYLTDRELTAVQAIVLTLLSSLFSYAIWLIYIRDWSKLVGLLPSATAACAALLVAKSATRLLNYNKFTRADDRAHDIVQVTHHSIAVIKDLHARVNYMKIAFSEGNRPIVAITQNAEVIQRRYEALYDRELYRYLPGNIIDAICNLSGGISGLSILVEGIASTLGSNKCLPIPSRNNATDNQVLIQTISQLESEIDALLSQITNLRAAIG